MRQRENRKDRSQTIKVMARGKIQMKKIENSVHRQVTFCKRRAGLFKKAKELSVLCDAEIGVFVFSSHGKLFELATKGGMQGLIERYIKYTGGAQPDDAMEKQYLELQEQIHMLKLETELLQKGLRCMIGKGIKTMTLDELGVLEKHLEILMYHVRSTKMEIMFQEIQLLKNKEGILTEANKYLQQKMVEQSRIFDIAQVITNFPEPLTVPNDIFQF
ncbi:Transcription factor, MADS-box [Dillenia turbinata]|uniref:Transcription factor, MADS-box n=1 Tax=Dillenia turbinata TaxID=194707 RepID=A0AAN8ZEN0_9MAGN